MRRITPNLVLAGLALAVPAAAKSPSVHVTGWARAGVASAAAYVSVHNGGNVADRLVGAASPAASSVTLHDSRNVGGVMRMRAAGAVPLPVNGTITMKPGGLHVMLVGLKSPLLPGSKLPITLRFERAGTVRAALPVLPAGAQGPGSSAHHGH